MDEILVEELIEEALLLKNPTEALRKLAININRSGLNKETIYEHFLVFYDFLQTSNRQQDADILGDVMDMMRGWYVGRELNLK